MLVNFGLETPGTISEDVELQGGPKNGTPVAFAFITIVLSIV